MMISQSARRARPVLTAVLLASIAGIAAACSSGTPAPAPSVTSTQSPPAGTSTPAGTPSPATSSPQAGPAECQTAALRVSVGASNGAAGTIYYNLDFTNTSSATCFLQGYPGVSLVSAGSDAGSQIGADAKRNPTSASVPVTLAPGQVAHAALGITHAENFTPSSCHVVTAHWLKVFPPDQRAAAYVPFTTTTCASTSIPTMHIAPVSPGA